MRECQIWRSLGPHAPHLRATGDVNVISNSLEGHLQGIRHPFPNPYLLSAVSKKPLQELGNESIFLLKPITWTFCLAIFRDACEALCSVSSGCCWPGAAQAGCSGGCCRRAQLYTLFFGSSCTADPKALLLHRDSTGKCNNSARSCRGHLHHGHTTRAMHGALQVCSTFPNHC